MDKPKQTVITGVYLRCGVEREAPYSTQTLHSSELTRKGLMTLDEAQKLLGDMFSTAWREVQSAFADAKAKEPSNTLDFELKVKSDEV